MRFPLRSLYVLTDPNLSHGRSHVEIVREAIAGGAEIVQLRDKSASTRELVQIGETLRQITYEAGVVFIVNDRVDVALAVEADGVHLGAEDMPIGHARRLMDGKIVGASVDNEREAIRAVEEGADYVAIGPIFPTTTKPDAGPVADVDMIRRVKEAVDVPVVAGVAHGVWLGGQGGDSRLKGARRVVEPVRRLVLLYLVFLDGLLQFLLLDCQPLGIEQQCWFVSLPGVSSQMTWFFLSGTAGDLFRWSGIPVSLQWERRCGHAR